MNDKPQAEKWGGVLLLIATLAALLCANSALSPLYSDFLHKSFEIRIDTWSLHKSFLDWIDEGLMTLFFVYVGLELKHELITGALSQKSNLILPVLAAFGGMFVPACIYVLANQHDPIALKGWAIPTATDLAFALGLLSFFSHKIPHRLKIFLLSLAILDDLGGILVIAFFYTNELSWLAMAWASVALVLLIVLNRLRVQRLSPYLVVGALLWLSVLKSGVHATLAGVIIALAIPHRPQDQKITLRDSLEDSLGPWVRFAIVPLFAFANAGVPVLGLAPSAWFASIPLGIAGALIVGKPLGVMGFSWLSIRMKWGQQPAPWPLMFGVAVICGIGFTMSLFIGSLAFTESQAYLQDSVRLGILMGSFTAALLGGFILYKARPCID